MNRTQAVVYSEDQLGQLDGKVANGLVRHSEKYEIVGVIDSTKAGMDAGEYLDGVSCGIPVFRDLDDALARLDDKPDCFIYGIAPLQSFLDRAQREVILHAMSRGLDIVNGMPEFLTEDAEFQQRARQHGVQIHDVRKPPPKRDLHLFTGDIFKVETPVVTVLGTDCAVGKRTSAVLLVEALRARDLKAVFIATGQTGLLQGAQYGVAVDVLSSGFQTGEVEHAVVCADAEQRPDIIVVEGQGALGHPAFTSSTAIVRGAMPRAIVLQHPPRRVHRCDYPEIPMPSLRSEIDLIEAVTGEPVVAIALNHEDMSSKEVARTVTEYEALHVLPTVDVLQSGCDKIVAALLERFPRLRKPRGIRIRRGGRSALPQLGTTLPRPGGPSDLRPSAARRR